MGDGALWYSSTLPLGGRYLRPRSVDEAVAVLAAEQGPVHVLSGGTDMVPLMRNRAVAPACVVDITGIPELDRIRSAGGGGFRLGALVTLTQLIDSSELKAAFPLLIAAATHMASPTARQRATLMGNVCRASPAADTAGPLLCLDAAVHAVSLRGERRIPVAEVFRGPGRTALAADELATEVEIPPLPEGAATAFLKLSRVSDDLAKVSVSAILVLRDGRCQEVRLALGAVAATPLRARRAEAILAGQRLTAEVVEAAAEAAAAEASPIDDLRSTRAYRSEMVNVLVRRAISGCAGQAGQGG